MILKTHNPFYNLETISCFLYVLNNTKFFTQSAIRLRHWFSLLKLIDTRARGVKVAAISFGFIFLLFT